MRPIFPLLLFPLLLVACALPVRDGMVLRAPQESPTAKTAQEGPGAFERVAGQETQNGAFLMGETGQIQATSGPSATAGPNLQATIDAMVRYQIKITENARADAMLIAKYTATQQAFDNAAVVASQTAQKPASTATKAAQDAEATQQTAYITQSAFIVYATQNAPAQELAAENAKAQTGSATFRAWAQPIMQVGVGVGSLGIAIFLIGYVAVGWKRQGAAVEAEPQERDEFPELQKLNPAPQPEPYTPMVKRVIPAHVPEGVLIRFAQTVKTSHNTGGVPFSRAKWVDAGMMSRRSWDALMDFFSVHEYALKLGDADSSPMAFTPEGVRYLRGFENDPPTEGEYPISA